MPERPPAALPADPLLLDDIKRHITVARRLGIEPLTVVERASAMLDAACSGWRNGRRCRTEAGLLLDHPHSTCLRAQYHHDVLLLEHGLLTNEKDGQ